MPKQPSTTGESGREPTPLVFTVTGRGDPAVLARRLPAGLTLSTGPPEAVERTFLDTFDWRLWRGGATLEAERGPGGLVVHWRPGEAGPVTVAVGAVPNRAGDLPPGGVAREAGPRLGVRALLPLGVLAGRRRCSAVCDGDGKTVARVWWEGTAPLDSAGSPGAARQTVRLEPLRGYEAEATAVATAMTALEWLAPAAASDLELAAAARGRRPGDYSSRIDVPLAPETAATEAVRAILAHLHGTAKVNVAGTVADLDPEFLHDLRVAVRRARSALGQLRGAYDQEALAPLLEELRWLGTVTGPCRDMDVFVLDLEQWSAELGSEGAAALAPLARAVKRERAAAQAAMAGELRSPRFRGAMALWRRSTARPWRPAAGVAPEAGRDVRSFGGERVARAYRRLRRHARGLDAATPPEVLHRLRIDGKKLRYLLEFFAAVLGDATAGLVKQLRSLQDELGAFNDLAVQQHRLEEMAHAAHAAGEADVPALLAAGRLGALMAARQQERRAAVAARLEAFFAREVRDEVARLAGGSAPGKRGRRDGGG